MCAIVKDQPEDLKEWIDYHHAWGAGKFYLYDNGSATPVEEVLREYVAAGLVVVAPVAAQDVDPAQHIAYRQCIDMHGHKHLWLGFLDIDEFIVVNAGADEGILHVLARFEDRGALALNWINFGSSGHVARPRGGIGPNYTSCTDVSFSNNQLVKCIVNTRHTISLGATPHEFTYQRGFHAVNTEGGAVRGARNDPPTYALMHVNHYVIQSREDYERKRSRWRHLKRRHLDTYFEDVDRAATRDCPPLRWPAHITPIQYP
jgi:Glycosyltransferase family 92